MVLRLILGDQLNHQHSWSQDLDDGICYFMTEMRQETDYVKHHIQKVTAFFLSMRIFPEGLKNQGFDIIYYTLDEPINQQDLLKTLCKPLKKRANNIIQNADEY